MRLFFLPGLACDERIFARQLAFFPEADVLLFHPEKNETLSACAARIAEKVLAETENDAPCAVIGLSLGGMLAPFVAAKIGAKKCILISSVRGKNEFPRRWMPFHFLMKFCPPLAFLIVLAMKGSARLFRPILHRCLGFAKREALTQFLDCTPKNFFRSAKMMFAWAFESSSPDRPFPDTFHIHGDKDSLIPPGCVRPDRVIPRAGHLLLLTHAEELNEILAEVLEW